MNTEKESNFGGIRRGRERRKGKMVSKHGDEKEPAVMKKVNAILIWSKIPIAYSYASRYRA